MNDVYLALAHDRIDGYLKAAERRRILKIAKLRIDNRGR